MDCLPPLTHVLRMSEKLLVSGKPTLSYMLWSHYIQEVSHTKYILLTIFTTYYVFIRLWSCYKYGHFPTASVECWTGAWHWQFCNDKFCACLCLHLPVETEYLIYKNTSLGSWVIESQTVPQAKVVINLCRNSHWSSVSPSPPLWHDTKY